MPTALGPRLIATVNWRILTLKDQDENTGPQHQGQCIPVDRRFPPLLTGPTEIITKMRERMYTTLAGQVGRGAGGQIDGHEATTSNSFLRFFRGALFAFWFLPHNTLTGQEAFLRVAPERGQPPPPSPPTAYFPISTLASAA